LAPLAEHLKKQEAEASNATGSQKKERGHLSGSA
jgi:hypothetical protein